MNNSGYLYVIQRQMLLFNSRTWQALGGKVDGLWGPKTQAAINEYQRSCGLKVDGIVGRGTWESFGYESDVIHSGGYVHFYKRGSRRDKITEKYGSKWYTRNRYGTWFSYR